MPPPRPPNSPFRPNLYVVARFLDALAAGARTRADLQAAAGVNYDIFRRYLDLLAARGYVVAHPDGTVALTVDGRRVRGDLRRWIEAFLAPPRPDDPEEGTRDPRPADAG